MTTASTVVRRRRWLRISDWPLRAKVVTLVVLAAVIPLALAAIIDVREGRQRLLANAASLLAARGDQMVRELDTFNTGYERAVDKVARLPTVIDFLRSPERATSFSRSELVASLDIQSASDPNIRGVGLLDLSGHVALATEAELVGKDLSFREHVRKALLGVPVISDVYVAGPEVDEVPTIAYLAPVRGPEREKLGVVVLWIRANSLWKAIRDSNELIGPGSFAELFDSSGVRIAHTVSQNLVFRPGGALDPSVREAMIAEHRFGDATAKLLDEVRPFPEQFERARADRPEREVFRGNAPFDQATSLGVARRFRSVSWTVFYMMPEGPLLAAVARDTRTRLAYAGLIMLLSLLAGSAFATLILQPIGALTRATKRLSAGDLGARAGATGEDEIGELGRDFDGMAERLEAQARALQQANETLELKVSERTAELASTLETLRASEARKGAILESALDSIVTIDETGTLIEFNPAAERTFGHARSDALGKKLVQLLIPEALREAHLRGMDRYLAGGDGPIVGRRTEVLALHADGHEFPVELAVVPIAGAGPRLFTAYIRDITDRQRAVKALEQSEQSLRRAEDQLRQSQKMEAIGTLAGGIAHDFNNLLSVVLSYSEMLVKDLPPGDPVREDIEQIAKAGRRAHDLTRQLLAFSRQQVLEPRTLDLNQVISGTANMLRRLIGEDIELTLLPAAQQPTVFVDPGQIEQVLMNLVVNARDAMPQGGKLTIETADVALDQHYVDEHLDVAPGSYVMFSVSDTGTGIDEAVQARIFEPFFTTKEKGRGTGLGLSTVFGIVKQSGGSIFLYSEPGAGTTFKIYLPRSSATESPSTRDKPLHVKLRGHETVLLVEDDAQVRDLALTILRRHGYHVLEARTGGDALLVCEQFRGTIHALLTDVVMPRMSGRELAERLALLRPQMRRLFMSGYTDDAIVHHGVLSSEMAFVQKPLMPEALLRKLREVLSA